MTSAENQDRSAYLEANFPRQMRRKWHAPGRFTDEACRYLARPIRVDLALAGARYAVVDAFESSGNPLQEIVRFRFRLSEDPQERPSPHWGRLDEPLKGTTAPAFYFYFISSQSLSDNIADFQLFVADQLDDRLVHSRQLEDGRQAVQRVTVSFSILVVLAIVGMAISITQIINKSFDLDLVAVIVNGAIFAFGGASAFLLGRLRSLLKGGAEPSPMTVNRAGDPEKTATPERN